MKTAKQTREEWDAMKAGRVVAHAPSVRAPMQTRKQIEWMEKNRAMIAEAVGKCCDYDALRQIESVLIDSARNFLADGN